MMKVITNPDFCHYVGIEYHEVVEEYGLHWNFFFTLAAVKLLSASIFSFVEPSNSLKLSVVTGIAYEIMLVNGDLGESYVLNSAVPRNGLVEANREGIFSVLGYLSIYFGSVYVGKVIYSVKKESVKDWLLYACQSGAHVLLLWVIFLCWTAYGNPASRRAANLSYVIWILATNYTILWASLAINIVQSCGQHLGLLHGPLITFELNALMERQEEKIKKLNEEVKTRKKKKRYGKSAREVQVEEQILVLEDKLKEFKQSGKASISSEVASLIEHIEEELELIGKEVKEEEEEERAMEKDKQREEETTERNLISMPDLAKSPVTLDAICYNGLGVFLLGNLLTGLVNCMVHTIYVPDYLALCYLWAYSTCVSVVSLILYTYQIQLKFW
jgi:hypothetical protein